MRVGRGVMVGMAACVGIPGVFVGVAVGVGVGLGLPGPKSGQTISRAMASTCMISIASSRRIARLRALRRRNSATDYRALNLYPSGSGTRLIPKMHFAMLIHPAVDFGHSGLPWHPA